MSNRATGKVVWINVLDEETLITLDIEPENAPLEQAFLLARTDPNYNARYSLALSAAVNRLPLTIRTAGEIDPKQYAGIRWMAISWAP